MYSFPDSVSILKDSIESLGYQTFMYLTPSFAANLPAVHIYKVGGLVSSVFSTDRFVVDVYATNRDEAFAASEEIQGFLLKGPHSLPYYAGLIDRIVVESSPSDIPYADETIIKFTSTFRAEMRAL